MKNRIAFILFIIFMIFPFFETVGEWGEATIYEHEYEKGSFYSIELKNSSGVWITIWENNDGENDTFLYLYEKNGENTILDAINSDVTPDTYTAIRIASSTYLKLKANFTDASGDIWYTTPEPNTGIYDRTGGIHPSIVTDVSSDYGEATIKLFDNPYLLEQKFLSPITLNQGNAAQIALVYHDINNDDSLVLEYGDPSADNPTSLFMKDLSKTFATGIPKRTVEMKWEATNVDNSSDVRHNKIVIYYDTHDSPIGSACYWPPNNVAMVNCAFFNQGDITGDSYETADFYLKFIVSNGNDYYEFRGNYDCNDPGTAELTSLLMYYNGAEYTGDDAVSADKTDNFILNTTGSIDCYNKPDMQ